MIGLLIHLLILCLVVGLVCWIFTVIISNIPGVPPVFRQIVVVVMMVILLIVVLEQVLPYAGLRGGF